MPDSLLVRQLLTDNLRNLVKAAGSSPDGRTLTSSHRQAIREICASTDYRSQQPEQLLIAFKTALSQAANEAQILASPERTDLFEQFVSLFIEELYGAAARRRTVGDGDGRRAPGETSILSRNPGLADARP